MSGKPSTKAQRRQEKKRRVREAKDRKAAERRRADLEGLAAEFGSHVLVAPNPAIDAPVVATAWLRRMRLEELDVERLRDFATAFRGQGPESVDCPV